MAKLLFPFIPWCIVHPSWGGGNTTTFKFQKYPIYHNKYDAEDENPDEDDDEEK